MLFNRRRFYAPLVGLLTLGCGMASTAHADAAADNDAENTGTLVVKGDRKWTRATTTAKASAEYGTDVQVITSAQIDQSGAVNLAEAMQYLVKGVNIGYSPDEGEFTIRLDGGADRDTLVTLDGVPTYDRGPALENIWGATTIDPHMIENIEVYRGGNSLYFGSNGGIGVVNIITKKPDGTKKGEFGVNYGSFQTREIWGNYSFPLDKDGKHSLMFYGTMLATDSPRIFDPSLFTDNVKASGGVQAYPYNRNDIGLKYLWQIDADTEFRAGAIYTESWFQDAFPNGESYSPNTLRYPILDASFKKSWGDKLLVESSVYYSNPKLWNAEVYPEICQIKPTTPYVPGTLVPDTCVNPNNPQQSAAFPNGKPTIPYGAWTGAVEPAAAHGFGTTNQHKSGYKEFGATARATLNVNKYLEVVGGVQWVSYKDDSSKYFPTPDNDFKTTGVFIDVHPKLPFSPDTKISLAVRTDFSDAFDSKTIYKFGLRQPFLKDFYLRANGGTSYSAPQTNELYINNPRPADAPVTNFNIIGNPDLEPEETKTFNAAVGFKRDFGAVTMSAELGGFDTEISKRISTTSGTPFNVVFNGQTIAVNSYFNDSAITKILGVTAELDFNLGSQWHVNLGYTSQDASPVSGSKKGQQIGETPSWFAVGAVDWTSKDKRLKLQLLPRFQGDEFATGGPALPGTTKAAVKGIGADSGVPRYRKNFGNYTVVNATATYLMGENMQHRFQLRVVNLFNEYYAERYGYGNQLYGAAFNRGEYTNTDDRYFYGYPFEGKPRSFYMTFATTF